MSSRQKVDEITPRELEQFVRLARSYPGSCGGAVILRLVENLHAERARRRTLQEILRSRVGGSGQIERSLGSKLGYLAKRIEAIAAEAQQDPLLQAHAFEAVELADRSRDFVSTLRDARRVLKVKGGAK